MYNLISLVGLFGFVGLGWLLSNNRRKINWQTVGVGLLLQFLLGIIFLLWTPGTVFLHEVSDVVKEFLGLSFAGSKFIFGELADAQSVEGAFGVGKGFLFAFQILPTIIFFSSFLAVLYHLGIMQRIVQAIGWVMVRLMKTSGSESLSVSGNIFVGQTEAPLLVKPFLDSMTRSELFTVMVGGFATIAGGVFALYVGILDQAGFKGSAGHLLIASVMSAPAALVMAKLLFPETEESDTFGRVNLRTEKLASNALDAAATGALDGLKLALNVAAMLIAFLALLAMVNWVLAGFHTEAWLAADKLRVEGLGQEWSEPIRLQNILGWVFSPLAAMLGVNWNDIPEVGTLLGTKIAVNELVAYSQLGDYVSQHAISERSARIATYALCGFANFSSVAIQIGGISALAPGRKRDLASFGIKAMMGGAFASWMTACVVGVLD